MLANFERVKTIGQGNQGVVYLVQERDTKEYFALKELNKECPTESELMKALYHPNILKIYKCGQQESNRILLLEYIESGDLTSYISQGFELEQNLVISLLAQIALAMHHCHFENDIIHRDIKLENILLASNGLIKLADFGVSKRLAKEQKHECSYVGTPVTMSPERISSNYYDFKSDIWSLGCVVYQLMAKKKPFSVETTNQPRERLRQKILHQKPQPLPERYSEWLRNLVFSMLSKSSQKRPSAQEILEKKQIQKQLLRLRDKYPQYKQCKYMSVTLDNPKTTKFTEREQKQFGSMPVSITQSLKTTKSKVSSSQLKVLPCSDGNPGKREEIDTRFYTLSLPFFVEEARKRREKGQ